MTPLERRRAVAMEKAQWEKPVDGGAISERGRLEAAKNQVVVLQTMMKSRGCKEDFVPNQALLEQGQVLPRTLESPVHLSECSAKKMHRWRMRPGHVLRGIKQPRSPDYSVSRVIYSGDAFGMRVAGHAA